VVSLFCSTVVWWVFEVSFPPSPWPGGAFFCLFRGVRQVGLTTGPATLPPSGGSSFVDGRYRPAVPLCGLLPDGFGAILPYLVPCLSDPLVSGSGGFVFDVAADVLLVGAAAGVPCFAGSAGLFVSGFDGPASRP